MWYQRERTLNWNSWMEAQERLTGKTSARLLSFWNPWEETASLPSTFLCLLTAFERHGQLIHISYQCELAYSGVICVAMINSFWHDTAFTPKCKMMSHDFQWCILIWSKENCSSFVISHISMCWGKNGFEFLFSHLCKRVK